MKSEQIESYVRGVVSDTNLAVWPDKNRSRPRVHVGRSCGTPVATVWFDVLTSSFCFFFQRGDACYSELGMPRGMFLERFCDVAGTLS